MACTYFAEFRYLCSFNLRAIWILDGNIGICIGEIFLPFNIGHSHMRIRTADIQYIVFLFVSGA